MSSLIKGVTFNGVHSNAVHLIVSSSRRPLFAETKDDYRDLPKRSGGILIPDNARLDVQVEIDFALKPPKGKNLYEAAREVGAWLSTTSRAELIFDDDPNYVYMGKITGSISLEKVIRAGKFTAIFRCLPDEAGGADNGQS